MIKKAIILIIILYSSIPSVTAQVNQVPVEPLPSLSLDTLSFVGFNKVFSGNITDDTKVVGLGAPAYTLSESVQLNSKLIQYLVTEKGFKTIVLPMDNWELNALNAYLTNGKAINNTDINDITKQTFSQNVYYTEETLTLLKWVKGYNNTHKDVPVQFSGMSFINPPSPDYILAKYVIPVDSLAGVQIAKSRGESQSDSVAYHDILTWFYQKNNVLKKQLTAHGYSDVEMIVDNLGYLKKWNTKPDTVNKLWYFDHCLYLTTMKLLTTNKKLLIFGDNKMITRSLMRTDVTWKNLGTFLDEGMGKSYYVILSDFYNKADFYAIDSKVGKMKIIQRLPNKTSTAYMLHEKYNINGGIALSSNLKKLKIPTYMNIYDLSESTQINGIIQPNIPAFDALIIFSNENPVKPLRRSP
jgi:erythromycin esterase-like protein